MSTSITVELDAVCDERTPGHGHIDIRGGSSAEYWLHQDFNHSCCSDHFGGSGTFLGSSRADVKRQAKAAGWWIPGRGGKGRTLCPRHAKMQP